MANVGNRIDSSLAARDRFTWSGGENVTIVPGKRKRKAEQQRKQGDPPAPKEIMDQFVAAAQADRKIEQARGRVHRNNQKG